MNRKMMMLLFELIATQRTAAYKMSKGFCTLEEDYKVEQIVTKLLSLCKEAKP